MGDVNEKRTKTAKKKPRGKPFEKGNKMGGRKAIPQEVRELIYSVAPEMVEKKINIARDPNTAPQLVNQIAEELLNRAYGKPTQSVDIESTEKMKLVVKLVTDDDEEGD